MSTEKIETTLINKDVNTLNELPKNARIILVVGNAGSGKTNIIHNFLNIYEKKLSLDDPNKFQLAGTQKKVVTEYGGRIEPTSRIQAYQISNPEDEEAPLVFIDTPPFDDRVAKDYLEAINNYLGDQQTGIDGILYTIDSSTDRLGVKERNAFTLVKQLKDKYLIGDSLFVASTNADLMGLRCVPLLIDALETETGRIFNFCINPLKEASKDPNIHRMQSADWERSTKSLNNLAKKLETLPKNTRTRENSNPKALNKIPLTDASSTHSSKDRPRLSEIPLNTLVNDISTPAFMPTSEPVKSEINSPKAVTSSKTEETPSNKTLPVQNDKTQKPALSHFNMTILNGFITVLGIAMMAVAFTLLNAATGGGAGVALASVGACALLLGVGLFFKNRANSKLPESSESPAVRPA